MFDEVELATFLSVLSTAFFTFVVLESGVDLVLFDVFFVELVVLLAVDRDEDFGILYTSSDLGNGISTSFSLAVANLKSGDPLISAKVLGSYLEFCLGLELNMFLSIFTENLQSFFYIVPYFSIYYK